MNGGQTPGNGVRIRRIAAVNAGKLAGVVTRLLGRGGGTSMPGVVATAVDPRVIADLSKQLNGGAIAVSGTNGKTTTCKMLATVLTDAGLRPVRNESGSNLLRGLASSLVQQATLFGNMPPSNEALGLFETDEAALPAILEALSPTEVLLLNLFRDQLDRYGEVAIVARIWTEALSILRDTTRIVVNADDPLLAQAITASGKDAVYFGVASTEMSARSIDHASDVKSCPQCGEPITYDVIFLGHLGKYRCTSCNFARPEPIVTVNEVRLDGIRGSRFRLQAGGDSEEVMLTLPGMYNVYNALAAAAVAWGMGIPVSHIARSLGTTTAAFGRMERLTIDGRSVYLALVKNPSGLNEVLRTIVSDGAPLHLLVMLNDNTADGRDVSWIWDTDVEILQGQVASVTFSGIRATDMALRFKYAGIVGESDVIWKVDEDPGDALSQALNGTPLGGHLFILPTYTALLNIRDILAKQGHVQQYWEE